MSFTNSATEVSQSMASAPSKFPLLEASSPVERATVDPQFPQAGTSTPWSPPMPSSLHWHGAAALLDTKPLTPVQNLSGRPPSTTSLSQQVVMSRHVPNLVARRAETPLERTGFTPLGTTRSPFRVRDTSSRYTSWMPDRALFSVASKRVSTREVGHPTSSLVDGLLISTDEGTSTVSEPSQRTDASKRRGE